MFEVSDHPSIGDITTVADGLAEFNELIVGPANRRSLAVISRNADGLKAGLLGYTARGVLHVEKVWVSTELRGRGIGTLLLAQAEDEALHRSCSISWLETLSPDAARFYERLGYERFGAIPGFPNGRERVFFRKTLGRA